MSHGNQTVLPGNTYLLCPTGDAAHVSPRFYGPLTVPALQEFAAAKLLKLPPVLSVSTATLVSAYWKQRRCSCDAGSHTSDGGHTSECSVLVHTGKC
eukprot:1157874-Pelagomonas_calceolata.AAC.4